MPQITTDEWNSISDGGFPAFSKLAIQNRAGAVSIYHDTTAGNVANTGQEIVVGATYEYPSCPYSVNLATASGTASDVRVIAL